MKQRPEGHRSPDTDFDLAFRSYFPYQVHLDVRNHGFSALGFEGCAFQLCLEWLGTYTLQKAVKLHSCTRIHSLEQSAQSIPTPILNKYGMHLTSTLLSAVSEGFTY